MGSSPWNYWAELGDGLIGAVLLLVTGDPETWAIIRQSILISVSATLASMLLGVPIGAWLAYASFRGRGVVLAIFNTGFGLPPVVVGLILSILLLRHGQTLWLLGREVRMPLLVAYMAGFGAVVSEVGASQMLGGNLPGSTRVLTTAIVMETGMGHYDRAMAYGIVLLLLVALVVGLLTWVQQQDGQR
jgi:tungstate transport system permease protein